MVVTKLKEKNHSRRTNLLNSPCHPIQCDMSKCMCQMFLCTSLHSDMGESGKNYSSLDSLDMFHCQRQTCDNYGFKFTVNKVSPSYNISYFKLNDYDCTNTFLDNTDKSID